MALDKAPEMSAEHGPTLTRKGVTYLACSAPACPYLHLMVDGRTYAEWTHPRQPRKVAGR